MHRFDRVGRKGGVYYFVYIEDLCGAVYFDWKRARSGTGKWEEVWILKTCLWMSARMSVCPDPASVPSLARGDGLHEQVLTSLPMCQMSEDDLSQNPQFSKLLSALCQHMDETGLTIQLKKKLQKAEREVQLQKLSWLRSESLFRLIQEMIQEYHIRKQDSQLLHEDCKLYETLEQCLLVTQCVRELDPSSTTAEDKPQLLGLSKQNVLNRMPPDQDAKRMRQRLVREFEDRLKRKCFTILSYYQPDWEGESEGLKTLKLSRLPESLENESKRLESQRAKERESAILLHRQTHCYLSELLGCIQILQSLILDHRLRAQNDLDRKKTEYMEAKCQIIILKIRMEMLQVQLDTYTPKKIAVHRTIRDTLESALKSEQVERQSSQRMLSSFEILGQDFEAVVKEYSRLQQEIKNKKWALQEFSQYNH
ncbi:HAUS augmin-like complex subunit 4 isoform X2 [Acipenser ruthenus]|uniref:HAUS augmin-like complex subunit 4 isoform X2 n=1 Tax=Acipenser ruthenus TaxID=7906 RepID=UPI002740FAC3|nr:HAUS augmin-like complex subunit 4 isoform X2 [Acipenser ruthenus]